VRVYRPLAERPAGRGGRGGFTVEREEGAFRVRGAQVERMVVMNDLEDEEALLWLERQFYRLGLTEALQKAGAAEGTPVHIGQGTLTWGEPGLRLPVRRRRGG